MKAENRLFDPGPRLPPKPDFGARVTAKTDLIFDLKRFLENNLDAYIAHNLDESYSYHEKPLDYLWFWIEQQLVDVSFWTPEGEVMDTPGLIDIKFDKLSEKDVLKLHQSLGLNPEGTKIIRVVA